MGWGQGLHADPERLELQRPSTPHAGTRRIAFSHASAHGLSQAVFPSASPAAWATALVLPPRLRMERTAPFSALSILLASQPGGQAPHLLSFLLLKTLLDHGHSFQHSPACQQTRTTLQQPLPRDTHCQRSQLCFRRPFGNYLLSKCSF